MKVGYLGPIGTYTYEVCKKYIENKEGIEICDFKTISETIMALDRGEVDEVITPIENSTYGGVFETIDCLLDNSKLNIINELTMAINQCLLSKNNSLKDIKEIYSHPQAIAQCREYLLKNLPDAILIEVTSTTIAARETQLKENSACIGSKSCREIYGLNILDSNINDKRNNETRFVVISQKESLAKEKNKTSMVFSTKNEPGELYKVLGLFNIFSINLTKIESRPAKTKLGEYVFWIDFSGDKNEEHIKILLEQIKLKCSYFRILGSY